MTRTPLLLLGLLLVACGDPAGSGDDADGDGVDDTTDTTTQPGTCSSGEKWRGGEEGAGMEPGRACFDCHLSSGEEEAPTTGVAGTVYGGFDDPNRCIGEQAVTVEIIGADDVVTTLLTNASGNFLSGRRDAIVFPVTARVIVGDRVAEMVTPQASGDCNACHTPDSAQGRIQIP